MSIALHLVSASEPVIATRLAAEPDVTPAELQYSVHRREAVDAIREDAVIVIDWRAREVRRHARRGDPPAP